MTTLSPGDRVTLTIGGRLYRGTVLYVRDGTVRVEVPGRKPVTRPIARVKRVDERRVLVIDTPPRSGKTAITKALRALGEGFVPGDGFEPDMLAEPGPPALRPVPKPPKPDRDKAYLAFVRTRDCAECGFVKADVAHHHGPRGMGEKCSDYLTVPLCNSHHIAFHASGTCDGKPRDRLDAEWTSVQLATLAQWSRENGIDATIVMRDALVEAIRRTKE